MSKITRKFLRIWILMTSTAIFFVGWIAIAHAPKPAPIIVEPVSAPVSSSMPVLDPVPSLEELTQNSSSSSGSSQLTLSQPSVTLGMPRLRTRGS